jgi:arylsulfatase A-like enzyme
MSRFHRLFSIVVATFVVVMGHVLPCAAAARPNVLVILSDDQGYGDVSAHGNPVLKTPNLDKLHGESIRLTDFHVAPMCTPTRGQLMSGRDALHTGASSVCAGRSFLPRGTPTMAEIFRAAGYRTGLFGKWHLGDSYPNLPQHRGFEQALYHLGWGITAMPDVWLNDCFDPRLFTNGKLARHSGYCTDIFFDAAMGYMRERKSSGEPFFVYLPTNAPHGPHWVAEKYKQPYRELKQTTGFFGMIANLDENLGRLDAFLRESGLYDDTLVVYFNDNGATGGREIYNAGMRGHKTTYYDGGHRAMCFLRWPAGKFRPAGAIDELTEVQDLLPTLIELCGLDTPSNAKFDGQSLAGLLRGTQDKIPERTLVVQYGQEPQKWQACVMQGKWRLVHGEELYDVGTDLAQQHDLAQKQPAVKAALREHYESWWSQVEPRLYDFQPISIGAPQENPVILCSTDWANVYCDNMMNLRSGKQANGQWHLLVEQPGEYEIELRRWPREADAGLTAGVPEFHGVDGGLPAGKALPIAAVRLQIGDALDETRPVSAEDKCVTFTTTLPAGKTVMQSWCNDASGQTLCGAYFAYVRRK